MALLRAANELGFVGAMMGLPITAQFISLSVMPLIFGPISDRVGKKKVIAIFMVVFIAGSFLACLRGSAVQFLIGVFIIGAGYSVCECLVTASISDIFAENGEKYINLSQSFFCGGAIVSPLVLQALMDRFSASWRVSFLICAIAMAVVFPVFLLIPADAAPKAEQTPHQTKIENPLLLLGFVLCMFVYVGIESGLAYFADTVFTLELKAPSLGAYAIALFWAAMGLGRLFFGRIRKIPRYATPVSLFFMAAIMIFITLLKQETAMLLLFAAAGLACSCIWPGIVNTAVTLNRGASGAVMSYLNLGAGIGGALLPLVMGAMMDIAGISVAFLVLAILPVLTGIYIWRSLRKDCCN